MASRRHDAGDGIWMVTARWRAAVARVFLSVLAASLMSCSSDARSTPRVPAAKYTVQQFREGRSDPVLTIEGRGDFARGVMTDISYIQSRPFVEQLTIGNVTYTRHVDQGHWDKRMDAATPEAKALIAVRNALIDPGRSLSYLRSISTELSTAGTEEVRGDRTTHYRSIVDLGREQGPPGYSVSLDVWIDDSERTRRFRYRMLGDSESIVVWELYDFGVPVDITAPPADKVR
jgi:hypothetical protein